MDRSLSKSQIALLIKDQPFGSENTNAYERSSFHHLLLTNSLNTRQQKGPRGARIPKPLMCLWASPWADTLCRVSQTGCWREVIELYTDLPWVELILFSSFPPDILLSLPSPLWYPASSSSLTKKPFEEQLRVSRPWHCRHLEVDNSSSRGWTRGSVHCSKFSSISHLHPLDANRKPPVVTTKNNFKHCQMSPREQFSPQLRTADLN